MEKACTRWIAEARAHPDGAEALRNRVRWIDAQVEAMAASVAQEQPAPPHLEGLTFWDLTELAKRLLWAANQQEKSP